MTSTEKKVNKISNEIPIFEQGAVQANNSTTLCVTLVGVNRIFNCGHVEKRPLVGVESKHLKMLLDSNVFTGELMTSTEDKELKLFLKKLTKTTNRVIEVIDRGKNAIDTRDRGREWSDREVIETMSSISLRTENRYERPRAKVLLFINYIIF